MANQSNYYRNGNRTNMSALPSINYPDAGQFQGYSNPRNMRPTLPPQPMEIADLHISRTLPSLPTNGSGNIELLPPPAHGYGDVAYGNPNIARIYQQFPEGQIVRSAQGPIQDWYKNDGPWTHIPMVMPPNNAILEGRSQSKQAVSRNHITSAGQYRPHDSSESGSFHYRVPPPSDSGYASGTRRSVANTSVVSGDLPERDQDCHSLTGQVENFQPFPGTSEVMQQRDARSFGAWTPSVTSIPESRGMICPVCQKPVKTQSEMKKHELRHTKPFHCDAPGCTRTEGFSTPNDLDRHKKSKHSASLMSLASIKKYRCVVEGCKSRDKEWPRLDNFKSHLRRVHQSNSWSEQTMEDTLKKAEFWDHSDRGPIEELSVEKHTLPDLAQPPTGFSIQEDISSPRSGSIRMPYPEAIEPAHDLIAPKGPQAGLYESRANSAEERLPLPEIVKPGEVQYNAPDVITPKKLSLVPADHDDYFPRRPDRVKPHAVTKNSPQIKTPRQINISSALLEQLKHVLSESSATSNDEASIVNLDRSQPRRVESPKEVSQIAKSTLKEDRDSVATSASDSEDSKDSQAEKKALEVIDIITKLGFTIPKDPTHSTKQHNVGSVASQKSENQVTCQTCKRFTGRPCELKKHMKRHEKPYGCTFQNCNKVFGSKNDWKRHENSQHFHLEIWRCNEPRFDQIPCSKVCYRRMTFEEHLRKDHQIKEGSVVKAKTDRCRIGRNCNTRFWCGFCGTSVDLKKKGLEAWTERFDHIDDHFMGRGMPKQSILEWVPFDSDKPKGDNVPEATLDSSSASSSDKESVSSKSEHESSSDMNAPKPGSTLSQPLDVDETERSAGSKRRPATSEPSSRAAKKSKRSNSSEFIACTADDEAV